MQQWYIEMSRRLLNASSQLKIISELIWFSLYLYNTDVVLEEECQGDIPQKIVPRLVERNFSERIPPTGRKSRRAKRCVVCYKKNTRMETVFGALIMWPACMSRAVSRHTYHTKLIF
jgi:hypothetical protein